jgi:hypothetical protein
VLGGDDRLNDVCEIVYIGKGFDAEEDVIECSLLVGSIFRTLDDCRCVNILAMGKNCSRFLPNLGLKRSFPNSWDLAGLADAAVAGLDPMLGNSLK